MRRISPLARGRRDSPAWASTYKKAGMGTCKSSIDTKSCRGHDPVMSLVAPAQEPCLPPRFPGVWFENNR